MSSVANQRTTFIHSLTRSLNVTHSKIRGFPIEHSWVTMWIMLHLVAESICKILYITGCGFSLLKLLQKSWKYDSVTEDHTADNDIGDSTGQTDNPWPTGIGLRLLCNAPARLIQDRIRWHVAVIQSRIFVYCSSAVKERKKQNVTLTTETCKECVVLELGKTSSRDWPTKQDLGIC